MAKFRKKPVVIEAFQLPESIEDQRLTIGMMSDLLDGADWQTEQNGGLSIDTLEGRMFAQPGDWIIKGVAGEFYPCKPEIFAATYEPAQPFPQGTERQSNKRLRIL